MSKTVLPEIKDRIDMEIFYITCPHRSVLTLDSSVWCDECEDWVDSGDGVGDFTVYLHTDGNIKVCGSGYVEFSE